MKAYGIIEFLVNVLRESTWHISHRFRRAASIVHESEVTTRTRDTGGRVRWVRCVVICAAMGDRGGCAERNQRVETVDVATPRLQ